MRGGVIAKCNRPGAERVVHSAPLFHPAALGTEEEAAAYLDKRRRIEAQSSEGKRRSFVRAGILPRSNVQRKRATRDARGGASRSSPAYHAGSISREYFTGHSSKVMMLGFIDNGSVMISLDEQYAASARTFRACGVPTKPCSSPWFQTSQGAFVRVAISEGAPL